MTTALGGVLTSQEVTVAYQRVAACLARHNVPLPEVPDNNLRNLSRRELSRAVNDLLYYTYELSKQNHPTVSTAAYRNALAVFRRAVGSQQATGIMCDSAGVYQATWPVGR